MQDKDGLRFYLEVFIVVAVLGVLAAVAIPSIGNLFNKGKTESYNAEYHNVQTAVTQMLVMSDTGRLEPVGPTADMSQVQTSDTPPLVLSDYLHGLRGTMVRSPCRYEFEADGTVVQILP